LWLISKQNRQSDAIEDELQTFGYVGKNLLWHRVFVCGYLEFVGQL